MKVGVRLGLAALVLLVAAGGLWIYRNDTGAQPTNSTGNGLMQTAQVRRGNLATSISVVGELDAVQRADLRFDRMSGTAPLLGLTVKSGNSVKAGQVLATIDPAPYQQALDQARSTLRAAEENLTSLKTPPTKLQTAQADLAAAKAELQIQQARADLDKLLSPDIPTLEAAVAAARSALAKAQADLVAQQMDTTAKDQLKRLVDAETKTWIEYSRLAHEIYSDVYYEDRLQLATNKWLDAKDPRVTNETQRAINTLTAQMQVRTTQQALADAEKALASAQAGGDPLAIAQAKFAVREAEVALAAAQDERAKLDLGADAVTLAAAQADLDKARLAVADAQAALAGTKLTAPFDGTILKTNAQSGDSISADTAIVTLANLELLQVVAAVDETTIRRVTAGQNAQITFDAFPGRTLRGQVIEVPLQGALQGNVMVYDVPISLSGTEILPLLVGMTANVAIQLEQAQDAVLVPAIAVQRPIGGRGYQVLVPDRTDPAGPPQAVTVEIGLSDGINTQIVRGLNPGDTVLMQIEAPRSNSPFNLRNLGSLSQLLGGNRQPARGR